MSFLLDWLWDVLYGLGLFQKQATVLLVGLDNAGKTTLLNMLKNNKIHHFAPTQRAQFEEINIGRLRLRTWDLGGHLQVRAVWKEYFVDADAVIFVVDVADLPRIEEAKQEFYHLMADETLEGVPFLILGNKTDVGGSLDRSALQRELQLDSNQLGAEGMERRPMQIYMCSLIRMEGVKEALDWLSAVV